MRRFTSRTTMITAAGAVLIAGLLSLTYVGASTHWIPLLSALSKAEAAARPAITTAATNPVTFSAACNGALESAVLTWTTAGIAVTGYETRQFHGERDLRPRHHPAQWRRAHGDRNLHRQHRQQVLPFGG